ncbi:MAG: transglutaminase domain-containing protein [Novosphingobium sp.]
MKPNAVRAASARPAGWSRSVPEVRFGLRLALAFLLTGLAAPATASDTWFRITDETGQLIGWQRETVEPTPAGQRLTRERVTAYRIKDHAPARLTVKLVRDQTSDGRLLALSAETRRNRDVTTVRASVNGSTLLIEGWRAHRHTMRQLPHDSTLKLGDSEWLSGAVQTGAIVEIEPGSTDILAGKIVRSRADGEEAVLVERQGQLADAWIVSRDAQGEVQRAEKPFPGGRQVFERTTGPVSAADLSLGRSVSNLRFPSPFAISDSAVKGHIRYTFQPRAGAPVAIPETAEQRVRLVEGGAIRVDICRTCGPGLPSDAESLSRWRQPDEWIESGDPVFLNAARGVAAKAIPERSKMRQLGTIARLRISTVQFFGHYSAREAWRRRAGDCTEDAAVLVALARAAGIPARVANGLLFVRERYFGTENAFQPHSWVVAYVDGKWESFDISVDGFDATHIALSLGDNDPGSILSANRKAGLLQWQAMAEVRSR